MYWERCKELMDISFRGNPDQKWNPETNWMEEWFYIRVLRVVGNEIYFKNHFRYRFVL